MKLKTADLTGPALDWEVAKCEGMEMRAWRTYKRLNRVNFSTDWAHGGPIIERERIGLDFYEDGSHENGGAWGAATHEGTVHALGPTPLVAAMRCYVAAKLGDEVQIPEELA